MEWTREERYRRLEDVDKEDYQKLIEQVEKSTYRQTFHIQPKTGLLNDPNGFSYYQERYHLFYQWFPLGPVHGVKYWYHVSSKDLVTWRDEGLALEPDSFYDSHGVFSGSGLVVDDKLHLFYTGNTRTKDWIRIPYQCHAVMNQHGNIRKSKLPLISDSPKGFTDNFRDPKAFEYQGQYICLIGSETTDHRGKIVYYKSEDLVNWDYKGTIKTSNYSNSGDVWECPDYFEQDGQGVLLFSPQGMVAEDENYRNIFQSGYLMGKPIDFGTGQFDHQSFKEFDRGFDFYAPQTMEDHLGRRLLIGWMGLPGVDCVTDRDGWAHCLTLPRELIVENGHLYQRPVKELEGLRKSHSHCSGVLNDEMLTLDETYRTYELRISLTVDDLKYFAITLREGNGEKTIFSYDYIKERLQLDLTDAGETVTADYGRTRSCHFQSDRLDIHLFMDESSLEIFINDGFEVFTSRIYSQIEANNIHIESKGSTAYELDLWKI
ncbi:glycoside hydrolase family 32 protein [Streptococcus pluranimalium]|uniref:glycoside hydrolase family 32 protein n=1 Tax=Streptococcus pluranimalium TaxID=82348 RepID=UPI002415643D|nr:sucrose-6-phosphate hydrolase [Streptococcus pluranimalium]WFM79755.1 sucrose-6-phosphate hydrolase [Streptococcus pluranimalium]